MLTIFIISLCVGCSVVFANPFYGLIDPNCFVVESYYCPNPNVTFWLYKNTTNNPKQLDPLNLNPWDFKPSRPLKILIHGYTGYRDFSPNSNIRPVLLDNENVDVISIDYGPLVREPCYFQAVENLPLVSKCLAQLINNLVKGYIVSNENIHLIGFSLGGQVAGQTANYVKRKLKRITGLDPAKPMFITASTCRRLDQTDADFVDVIHTDVLGRGMLHPMGHADYYPNIGPYQPGCQEENPKDPGSCNHERAPRFYAESINSTVGFWAYSCPSWLFYTFGLCTPNGQNTLMGYHVNKTARGSYFLTTNATSPYALGQIPATGNSTVETLYYADNGTDRYFEPQLTRSFLEPNKNYLRQYHHDDNDGNDCYKEHEYVSHDDNYLNEGNRYNYRTKGGRYLANDDHYDKYSDDSDESVEHYSKNDRNRSYNPRYSNNSNAGNQNYGSKVQYKNVGNRYDKYPNDSNESLEHYSKNDRNRYYNPRYNNNNNYRNYGSKVEYKNVRERYDKYPNDSDESVEHYSKEDRNYNYNTKYNKYPVHDHDDKGSYEGSGHGDKYSNESDEEYSFT